MKKSSLLVRIAPVVMTMLFCSCRAPAQSGAAIEILSQSDTSMSVKFTDAESDDVTISFGRSTTNDVWMAQSSILTSGDPGIVFGNDEPTFATAVELRALEITPQEAIRTFGEGIAASEFDDITIYRLAGGESAIALWRDNSITEIWDAGTFVKDIIGIGGSNFCGAALAICCRKKDIEPPPETGPLQYPWQNTQVCRSILVGNCPQSFKDAACQCLWETCDFCFTYPAICASIPGLQEKSEAACGLGAEFNCDDDPVPPDPETPYDSLLKEMTIRLQALIDVMWQGP